MFLVVDLVPVSVWPTTAVHDTIRVTLRVTACVWPAHLRRIATTSCDGETGTRGPEVAAPRDEAFTSQDRPARAVWCTGTGAPTRLLNDGAETDLPEMMPLVCLFVCLFVSFGVRLSRV